MQHAGLQYGQGAVNAQSPSFADISGANTTSSLRQFRKKDGGEKGTGTDLNVDSSHIARVPPHNHYPARPNEYFRYQHQYPDYNSPFKTTPAQVKYSEIAETPPQPPLQHVDHLKHKDVHKDFMDMCNITQQTHMKQNYADSLNRQQNYPPDAASVHHQYLHKEAQVHPSYKPESQYQQYPQLSKYNMSQCRKYPPPPPSESDFLAKLQRINPTMARSIMSDHHIREAQTACPSADQTRMYPQNQRYYPMQNSFSYNYQHPYNYPSSCNYPRPNQMPVGGAPQYPTLNPHSDRSMSPGNLHMMNYGTSPQKISPTYPQYNAPEYAQHYQHRRTSMPQDYYQQTCRPNPYMGAHQVSSDPPDNRGSGGGLRHFIENWAEEEVPNEATPIFKENVRIHNDNNEQVFVINSSDIPPCLDVSLVATEGGQYIIKSGPLDNSVVRIRETTENNGERTVNLQIVEGPQKADCMLEEADKAVPYPENPKDCDVETKTSQPSEASAEEADLTTSVIVSNEVSVIKDMPIIEEKHEHHEALEELAHISEVLPEDNASGGEDVEANEKPKDVLQITSTTKRTQRIFSVDDIIGNTSNPSRRSSLQLPLSVEEIDEEPKSDDSEKVEFRNAISVEDDSVILEIGGALVQLNINCLNGTKVLSVLPLSESLVIDVNGNYQQKVDEEEKKDEDEEDSPRIDDCVTDECQSEVVIGEDNIDEVFLDLIEETVNEELVENDDESTSENLDDIVAQHEDQDLYTKETQDMILGNSENNHQDIVERKCEEQERLDRDSGRKERQVKQDQDLAGGNFEKKEHPGLECENHHDQHEQVQKENEVKQEEVKTEDTTDRKLEKKTRQVNSEEELKTEEMFDGQPENYKSHEKKAQAIQEEDTYYRKHVNWEEDSNTQDMFDEQTVQDEEAKINRKHEKKTRQVNQEKEVTTEDLFVGQPEKRLHAKTGQPIHDEEVKTEDTINRKHEKKMRQVNQEEESKTKEFDGQPERRSHAKKARQAIQEQDVKTEDAFNRKHEKKMRHVNQEKESKTDETFDGQLEKRPHAKKARQAIQEQHVKTEDAFNRKHEKKTRQVNQEKESKTEDMFDGQPEKRIHARKARQAIQEEEANNRKHEKKTRQVNHEGWEPEPKTDVVFPPPQIEDSKSENQDQTSTVEEEPKRDTCNRKSAGEIVVRKPDDSSKKFKKTDKKDEDEESKKSRKVDRASDKKPKPVNPKPEEEDSSVLSTSQAPPPKEDISKRKELKPQTKAAKKQYSDDATKKPEQSDEKTKQRSMSKLEETVNKIKSLKERSTKRVTFNLDTEVREISKDEMDRKKLSWEEYNHRKRKLVLDSTCAEEGTKSKIMEDLVTSSDDINDEVVERVALSIENAIKDARRSPPKAPSNWEEVTLSPPSPKPDSISSRKCVIDANEFNIKPIESIATPSPVSSSQFSYHSEDDSLQVYKDVVDSKLNSLNIQIPKLKPKPRDNFSVLLDRFLNKASLNCNELEKVKKIIEFKRKIEEKQLTYEVKNERDCKDLRLHFRKVPEKRKKKRFRNLYAEDSSSEDSSDSSDKVVADYSVYQRDSQGVPKLIFKRKSGLPQPFVKLERSQAVELLAKKKKLY